MQQYAQIIIHFATVEEIDKVFTYKIEEPLCHKVRAGHRVKVPFGRYNAMQTGYVLAVMNEIEPVGYPLKAVSALLEDEPILSVKQLDIAKFIAAYYGTSLAAGIEAVLPPGLTDKPFKEEVEFENYILLTENEAKLQAYIAQNIHKKTFKRQKYLLDYLQNCKKVLQKELENLPGVSKSSLKTLMQNEMLVSIQEIKKQERQPINYDAFKMLSEEQFAAKEHIVTTLRKAEYRTVFLQGVTGSGKTEVFLWAIKEVIEMGGSAIVLVPEIALTMQTLKRFEERFGSRVALTHSRMSAKERQRLYIKVKKGELSVIIGPRSAVFMPFENLKLIVIDEEHESTYKSESMPKYHAAEIAQMRMKSEAGIVLLASATPSMETYYHCLNKLYDKVTLNHRIGEAVLPEVVTIDMRLELKEGNNQVISRSLFKAIEETLQQGSQVMLLINRRGHSTFINCRSCGHVVKCKSCDVSMTYHLASRTLECHYCGKKQAILEKCPECGSKYIRFFGSGTEKIEEFLTEHFSSYGIGRMDLDTTTGKTGHHKILEAFSQRKVNILIGTQMIAKGHDFRDVALVGIISADLSLNMQDFRSHERTFQLLTQAIGRAGRGTVKGRVMIQTYNPEHIVLQRIKSNASALFYQEELKNRELMGYPPCGHIFTVLITGKNEHQVIDAAHTLAQFYKHYSQKGKTAFRVIGPTAAVLGKLVDEYRWRIIIIAQEREKLLIYGRYCLNKFYELQNYQNIKIQWDINPLNMM